MLHLPALDKGESMRLELRRHCLESTYFLGKAILGFVDMVSPLHSEMSSWICDDSKNRKLGLVPRDHLKTSIWTITDSIRAIAKDPNCRILIGNETSTNACHFLRRIEAVFERNNIFQWLFPEIIPDFSKLKKWSESEMLVPRGEDFPESTIETIGVGGAVVSRHFTLIKLDDLVGKEASESPDVMKKTIDWYQYCESLLVRPQDPIQVFGTRWAYNDLYQWITEKEPGVDVFFRASVNDCGEALWPERFNITELKRIKLKMGSFKFNCQYMNFPSDPESASFKEQWLRFYELDGPCVVAGNQVMPLAGLRMFMCVDPAISEKPGAARSAIVVTGVAADGRKFVLEAWSARCQPFDMINKIFEFQQTYDCESVGVESVVYQRILKPVIEQEAFRRGKWINIVEMRPDTRERKENRIRGIQPDLEKGLIWLRRDQEELLEEYRNFPVGKTVDILDALAYGPQIWSQPDDTPEDELEVQMSRPRMDGRSLVTGY